MVLLVLDTGNSLRKPSEGKQEVRMDVTKILEQLREERDQIEAAIVTLERLALGRGKRRGRPPSWMVEARKRTKPGDDLAADVIEAAVSTKSSRNSKSANA
jgi:hypothetical protein